MTGQTPYRLPHAVLDLASRRLKAKKIERLLGLPHKSTPLTLIDIGTGSGGIAYYFASHPTGIYKVTAIDVIDQRLVREGFDFYLVSDTTLPFPDRSFDIVISNHVLEHVGNHSAQLHHLEEIRRVMTETGIGYLAIPNRWMLVEPHYHLPLLSWVPEPMRKYYLRLTRRGRLYDCRPLTLHKLEKLLRAAGFKYRNLCTRAFRETMNIEGAQGMLAVLFAKFPNKILDLTAPIMPTLVYRLEPGP